MYQYSLYLGPDWYSVSSTLRLMGGTPEKIGALLLESVPGYLVLGQVRGYLVLGQVRGYLQSIYLTRKGRCTSTVACVLMVGPGTSYSGRYPGISYSGRHTGISRAYTLQNTRLHQKYSPPEDGAAGGGVSKSVSINGNKGTQEGRPKNTSKKEKTTCVSRIQSNGKKKKTWTRSELCPA